MSLTITDLVSDNKPLEITFGNKTLKLSYNPNVITTDMVLDLEIGNDELCKILAELIIEWDLEDARVEAETFSKKLSLPVVQKIFSAIIEDAFPKAKSTQSDDTTPQKARRLVRKAN